MLDIILVKRRKVCLTFLQFLQQSHQSIAANLPFSRYNTRHTAYAI